MGKLVHLSIDTAAAGPVYGCKIQPSFLLKFLIDAHLVLRVHDVESPVIGFQPGREFSGVGKATVSLPTFLGCDHNYSGHGFSPINGCGGSVFQNLEAFYVGVQPCYGRTDQGNGITGRKIIRTDINHIILNDTIYHP